MARSLVLGNGQILVGFDEYLQLRDFYFPYVGSENHIGGHCTHRIGVYVDGSFSWMNEGSWKIRVNLENESLEGVTEAVNESLGVTLSFYDSVYNEKNIFLRRVKIRNMRDSQRVIKLFFAHEFEIYESHTAHTAYFDPIHKVIIHYKGRRAFVINGRIDGKIFGDFTTGVFRYGEKEGSFRDAEDGLLAKNPIEHGPADSVLGLESTFEKGEEKTAYYWIAVATTIKGAVDLNGYVIDKGVEYLQESTADFWRAWINKRPIEFPGLTEECVNLFKKSLFIIRAHTNNNGSVIASSDSDMLQKGKDTYDYVWPRDAAFSALAMGASGYQSITREFFLFANDIVERLGYFMHKYNPDKSLGSSWHPWVRNGVAELPIQEDETALVVYALWDYYESTKDLELVENIYNSLIHRSTEFLLGYRDEYTRLPKPSYDLWEERFGIHTFTSASVFGGLMAAAKFAKLLGKDHDEKRWTEGANEIREGILKHLYDQETGMFHRMITVTYDFTQDLSFKKADILYDTTVDMSSAYGIFLFGVLPADDARLSQAMKKTEKALSSSKEGMIGGIGRYTGDMYHRVGEKHAGNPWFITTLWLAQYYIATAKNDVDLQRTRELVYWTIKHSLPSGIMPEQVHPYTGEPLSATPLTWSHAEYVRTVMQYLDRLEELGLCENCNPVH